MLASERIERTNLIVATLAVVASLAVGSPNFTASVAVGCLIIAVNYRVLRRATDRFFTGELGGGGAWSAGFTVRFLFLGASMWAALWAGADPIGLVLGLSTTVPAAVWVAWRNPPVAVGAPPAPPPDDPSWDEWNPWLARERDIDPEESA